MHSSIVQLFHTYGYWSLFGGMVLEYVFVPFPGETALVTFGILWRQGSLGINLAWLLTAATLGTFTGSLVSYGIGRLLGRYVIERLLHRIGISAQRIDRADAWFQQYTVPVLVISRFIAFMRVIVPYLAGFNRTRIAVFIPAMLAGSLVWTVAFVMAGGLVERLWQTFIAHWRVDLAPAVLLAALLVTGYIYFHRWLSRKLNEQHPKRHYTPPADTPSAVSEDKRRRAGLHTPADQGDDRPQDPPVS